MCNTTLQGIRRTIHEVRKTVDTIKYDTEELFKNTLKIKDDVSSHSALQDRLPEHASGSNNARFFVLQRYLEDLQAMRSKWPTLQNAISKGGEGGQPHVKDLSQNPSLWQRQPVILGFARAYR